VSRNQRVYLQDIVDACGKIRRFTDGLPGSGLLSAVRAVDFTGCSEGLPKVIVSNGNFCQE
jgi:hypothetical protein